MGRSTLAKKNRVAKGTRRAKRTRRVKRTNVSKKMQRLKRSVSKAKKSLKSKRTRRANKRRNNNRRSKRARLIGGDEGDVPHHQRTCFVGTPIIKGLEAGDMGIYSHLQQVDSSPATSYNLHYYRIGQDNSRKNIFGVRYSSAEKVYKKFKGLSIDKRIGSPWPSDKGFIFDKSNPPGSASFMDKRHIPLGSWLNGVMEVIFHRPPLQNICQFIEPIIVMDTHPEGVIAEYIEDKLSPELEIEKRTVIEVIEFTKTEIAEMERALVAEGLDSSAEVGGLDASAEVAEVTRIQTMKSELQEKKVLLEDKETEHRYLHDTIWDVKNLFTKLREAGRIPARATATREV